MSLGSRRPAAPRATGRKGSKAARDLSSARRAGAAEEFFPTAPLGCREPQGRLGFEALDTFAQEFVLALHGSQGQQQTFLRLFGLACQGAFGRHRGLESIDQTLRAAFDALRHVELAAQPFDLVAGAGAGRFERGQTFDIGALAAARADDARRGGGQFEDGFTRAQGLHSSHDGFTTNLAGTNRRVIAAPCPLSLSFVSRMLHRTHLVALSLGLALFGSCAAPQLTVMVNHGPITPDGEIQVDDVGSPATSRNTASDLGLDDDEGTLAGRVDLKFGSPHLTLSTQTTSWEGDGTLSADFGGITASTAVSSELDLGLHRAVITFDMIPTDFVEFGLGLGATLVDFNATVTDDLGAVSEKVDESVPVPVLAARLGGRIWIFDAEALVSGLSADIDGDEATYLELDLNGKIAFLGSHGGLSGSVVIGYRRVDLEIDYDDDTEEVHADLTFDGPYFGLQLGL